MWQLSFWFIESKKTKQKKIFFLTLVDSNRVPSFWSNVWMLMEKFELKFLFFFVIDKWLQLKLGTGLFNKRAEPRRFSAIWRAAAQTQVLHIPAEHHCVEWAASRRDHFDCLLQTEEAEATTTQRGQGVPKEPTR